MNIFIIIITTFFLSILKLDSLNQIVMINP